MNFGLILAARMDSKRLPGKAMLPLMGMSIISLIMKRINTSVLCNNFILATTILPEDDLLAETAKQNKFDVFRGDVNDVLGRYVKAAENYTFDYVVRVTGDCPFIDGKTLDFVLDKCRQIGNFDLVTTKPTFPHGIDFEVYSKRKLEEINRLNLSPEEREHHLNYIYRNSGGYKIFRINPPSDLESNKTIFLLDTPEDYYNMQKLVAGIDNTYITPSELIKKHNNAD